MSAREELVRELFNEAMDRVVKNEEPDPCMAVVAALCRGVDVRIEEMELILNSHRNGPWVIQTQEELQTFIYWCNESGVNLDIGTPVKIDGVNLYVDNFGDCVLAESSAGRTFAMWTRKGRLHVGFKDEETAVIFRNANPVFSIEATGNKRLGFVVVEGGDNPETINQAVTILKTL
jgi:hypothetical protein